ncbi:MAG TPA: lactate utilization protein [Pirellulaceae bacterium]|nr:lactate utilization protein [Pirellulaceae bacterium]
MDRTTFLQRVREAAHAGQAYRVTTRPIPPGTGYVGVVGDLCDHLAAEVNVVGGQAVVVDDLATARLELESLLKQYNVRTALCWQHELLDRLGLGELLAARQIQQHTHASLEAESRAEQRSQVLAADIGITSCQVAIAETGTLLMSSQPGRERMASLVPPAHVAVVEAAQVVPDLFDAFALLHQNGVQHLPSNLVLITGPSKTGDIELQLTTGVHGPKHWHVIVVRTPAIS